MTGPRTVLIARLDSDGDVLLSGPAVRAVASAARVILLCGPRGAAAGRLLPGPAEVVIWRCPWIDPEPPAVDPAEVEALVDRLRGLALDGAVLLTSYHQSPLPLALLLRLAGVRRITAASEDYPGSLLDVRHRLPETGLHEAERMLSTVGAAGFRLPAQDDGRLRLAGPLPEMRALTGEEPYVVVHPGASVPARAASPERMAAHAAGLLADGHRVVITGGPAERDLTAAVAAAASGARDLGGATDLAGLADVLARADAVVVGNTGPAHLAAAVGTPVVSLFAPTVPAQRWRPYQVPHVLLGDQQADCAQSRAKTCPVPGHPCLDGISTAAVVDAVASLSSARAGERAAAGVPA